MIIDHSMNYAHAMSYAHTMSYTYRMINTHDTYEQTELSNIKISLKISDVCLCSVTILVMPPKADYWKYFNVLGVVAYCLIAECKQPNVSLGALPQPGKKKQICE